MYFIKKMFIFFTKIVRRTGSKSDSQREREKEQINCVKKVKIMQMIENNY